MVGRATLTMKKSMIGSAAPSSTVIKPADVSPVLAGVPTAAVAVAGAVVVVVMSTTFR
ncbi:hypothetical protein GCM10027360_14760 [Amycolatopsis echigonensis]